MVHLIDKDALVAEIKKMRDKAYPQSDWNHGYTTSCEKILSFLDTLEVKKPTDVFIEKACDWLSKLSNYNEGFIYPSHSGVIDSFVNNFKNYMKEE